MEPWLRVNNYLILRKNINSSEQKIQIISSETSDTINSILRKVVSLNEGTANFANVEGYEVGGKTGTAYKSIGQPYTSLFHYLETFYDLSLDPLNPKLATKNLDLIFMALPHMKSMNLVAQFIKAKKPVIDLSGDFRLREPSVYNLWSVYFTNLTTFARRYSSTLSLGCKILTGNLHIILL